MSSPQPFLASSPLSAASALGSRRKSKFTFKHLAQLSQYNTSCPLRVVAHVDLDAFYAQCEMVRLNVPEDKPLGVQQWQGIIAINYPARKFGLNRHVTPVEAKKLCPEIILQHVATWKEGDEQWAYHENAAAHIATHKVSLDQYRRESKKILATIKETLPAPPLQRVEKASIDEVFIDLSAHVHSILLERYPALDGPPPYDDPTEYLPRPSTTALDWNTDHLIDLDEGLTEDDDPDWDDIVFSIASDIVRGVRKAVRDKLKYTMSGGLSRNKMLAKLGSGYKKPNQQTVIRNRAVQQFLSDFKFTKIRNLGGKLGDDVVVMFNTDTVEELLKVPLESMRKLGDDTGAWLYNTIRGEDNSEVNPRTQIKSMLSAKSFRPSINNFDQGARWLRIFAADIFSRCVEEGVLENKRRPKTINLHHRQGAQTRSRQAPIPQGKSLTEQILFELAKNLLAQVVVDGRAWPCANLSLSVGGFEDGISNNKGIGSFLVRGDEAKAMFDKENNEDRSWQNSEAPVTKRRKPDMSSNRNRFFVLKEDSRDLTADLHETDEMHEHGKHESEDQDLSGPKTPKNNYFASNELPPSAQGATSQFLAQHTLDSYFCLRCHTHVSEGQAEHDDWHFAKDLADEMRAEDQAVPGAAHHVAKLPPPRGRGRPPGRNTSTRKTAEKGQKTLAFGKG
jgi:DNA polymerase eta